MPDLTQDWQSRASCRTLALEVFYPDCGGDLAAARAVCSRCPVRAECLTEALRLRDIDGYRGGMTGEERHALLPKRPRTTAPLEEIVRLRVDLGWSSKAVAVACGVGTDVVHQNVSRARARREAVA